MGFWEQEEIEDALGRDVAEPIPELLRLCDLEVRIPRMDAIAIPLHSHTADIHKSVDAGDRLEPEHHLATAVHETGIPLEIETAITARNALPLH
jgi:hypothetical protein